MLQCNIFPVIKRALELRQDGSQTSVAKYAKMLEVQREGKIQEYTGIIMALVLVVGLVKGRT